MRASVTALVCLALSCSKQDPPVSESPQPVAPPRAAATSNPDDVAADDFVRAARAFYPTAKATHEALAWSLDCWSQRAGFRRAVTCLQGILAEIDGLRMGLGSASATTPCAQELEAKLIGSVNETAAALRAETEWVGSMSNALSSAQSLEDACAGNARCEKRPGVAKGPGMFADANLLTCQDAFLRCGSKDRCPMSLFVRGLQIVPSQVGERPMGGVVVKGTSRHLH